MLSKRPLLLSICLIAAGVSPAVLAPPAIAQEDYTLTSVIPSDVFLLEACRKNPERDFLRKYWSEVFQTLKESGIDEELAEMFGTSVGLNEVQAGEIDRIRKRFTKLIGEVQWHELEGAESAFAERMRPFQRIVRGQPTVMTASLVWLGRGEVDSTKRNFQALSAILDAVVEEANNAMGREALKVERVAVHGAQMASVNLLGALPGEPLLPLSVAMRKDTLMIAFREDLRDDVLRLMDGDDSQQALAGDARFQNAFSQLPPAEDSLVFFDAQELFGSMQESFEKIFDAIGGPHDVWRNTGFNAEASKINEKALKAYRTGEFQQALDLVKEAYEVEPKDSVILYNLACFHALVGNKDDALDWLGKAVDGGFYAPEKIATDADLKDLRKEPRYNQALAKAKELARDSGAKDVAVNFIDEGDVRRLRMQMQAAYEKQDYDQALQFTKQALELAPHDCKVLYAMGALHTLKGHKDKGIDFLEQAVESGFYCPKKISHDPDWKSVRDDQRFKAVLVKAEKKAGEQVSGGRRAKSLFVQHLLSRQMDAAAVMDYAATVASTDGHSVWSESITMLTPDAKEHDIYPVFSQRQPVADFARYLPKETKAFSISGGANLPALYTFIEDTIREGGPLGANLIAEWKKAEEKIGLDIEKDVFGLIEGDAINVTLADKGGSVWMMKVSDEQKAYQKIDEAMTALPKMINQAISKQPAMAGLATLALRSSKLEHESLQDFQSIHIALSPKPIGVWGTADGFLVFGSSADAVALCLATSRNEHPSIRQNPNAMKEALVPGGPFVSVSLSDHRSSSKDIATAMGAASMMGGMIAAGIPKPEVRPIITKMMGLVGKLAPVVRKVDFYKSVASTTTFDGQMWHTRSVTHYQSPAERAKAKEKGTEALEAEEQEVEEHAAAAAG